MGQDAVDVEDSSTSTNCPIDCLDIASAGSNPASGHSARQVVAIGDGGATLQYASVSSGGSLQINQACQINRTPIYIGTTGVTGVASETLVTCAITKGLVAQTAANSYTVTSGKIFRVQNISWQMGPGATTTEGILSVRIGGATTGTVVAQQGFQYGSTVTTMPAESQDLVFPDGYEFASGTVLSFSQKAGSTAQKVDVLMIGYEYTAE